MGPAEAAIVETFVAPRYLELYSSLALEMVAVSEDAQLAHLHCGTGFPERALLDLLPNVHIYGADSSPAAIELARLKQAATAGLVAEYAVAEGYPLPFPGESFSHALSLASPLTVPEARWHLLHETWRLLAPNGQALLALPLRDSYQELLDFLREYALKYDSPEVSSAVERMSARPTLDSLRAEFETVGFGFVEARGRTHTLRFANGRAFFEDPISRFCILPDLALQQSIASPERPLAYVKEAIDKYFSDRPFELTIHVGCVTGRRP